MIPNVGRILKEYTVKQLLVRVGEEYVWWLIRGWPGFEGVFFRYLFLRWSTKRLDGFCWISPGCTIANSYNLSIGKNFATNRNVHIDAIGGIEFGDDVGIGPNTVLFSQEHSMLTDESYWSHRSYRRKPIKVGAGAWIGANCFIKAGITIGRAAVVGACSNVITDVPDDGRVIGSPARPYAAVMREFVADARRAGQPTGAAR